MRRLKTAVVTLAFCAAAVGGLVLGYPWLEPARVFHDIHGIDVSHHQGEIDWAAVAGDGVGFAFIKATEGGDFVDPRFAKNWQASAGSGVPRGAYHFFTQCRPGAVQAENFIRTVPKDPKALPHVLDAEHMGPCRTAPQIKNVMAEILIFLDLLETHYGQRPLVYTTREFHDAYMTGRLAGERFWIRSLVIPPRFRRDEWVVWQYHNRGRRAGITGPVDLNMLRDGPSALAKAMGLKRSAPATRQKHFSGLNVARRPYI